MQSNTNRSHYSVVELALLPGSQTQYGYKLTVRDGIPAREFNDACDGEKAPKLIAHDWQQHAFKELSDGNEDELVAIGAQYYSIPEFIEDNGGLADFIAYQLQAIGKRQNNWDIEFNYTVTDFNCSEVIESIWEEIVTRTNTYLANDKEFLVDGFFRAMQGEELLCPLEVEDKHVLTAICKMFTKGYHFANKHYGSREHANKVFWAIVEALTPHVVTVTADSPDELRLYVNIHNSTAEVLVHDREYTTAS